MKTARARSSSQRSLQQWLKIALFAGATPFLCSCTAVPNETYYCRDENNQPIEGVLIVCRYSVSTWMAYRSAGADYRFTGSDGKAFFGRDEITRKLPYNKTFRIITYTYSPRLHCGAGGTGRYKQGEPYPVDTAYQKEDADVIFYKDNTDDSAAWFGSLYYLAEQASHLKQRTMGYQTPEGDGPSGLANLEVTLVPFVENEWKAFFERYGDREIPMDYFKFRFRTLLEEVSSKVHRKLTFNDFREAVSNIL